MTQPKLRNLTHPSSTVFKVGVEVSYCSFRPNQIITRASVGNPESENAAVFLAKRGVMVPGVPCVDRGNGGRETRHCLLVTEFGVLKVLASIAPYTFISHTKMSIFFRKGGLRIIFFKASQVSSYSKRSRGITTEPIAFSFCCYLFFTTLQ